jgi:GAF domain-containing protein
MARAADLDRLAAQEWISEHNVVSMMEWLSAELVWKRPTDPLLYLQEVVERKLDDRGEADYEPVHNIDCMREVYKRCSKSADTAAKLKPMAILEEDDAKTIEELQQEQLNFWAKLHAAGLRVTTDPLGARQQVLQEAMDLLNPQYAFLCHKSGIARLVDDELRGRVMTGLVHEVLKDPRGHNVEALRAIPGEGFCEWAWAANETMNVRTVPEHDWYERRNDVKNGLKTNSMIIAPCRSSQGECLALLVAINRRGLKQPDAEDWPYFSKMDEQYANGLARLLGVSLENMETVAGVTRRMRRQEELMDGLHAIHATNKKLLPHTATKRAKALTDADRGVMFLCDWGVNKLGAVRGQKDADVSKLAMDAKKSVSGKAAVTGKTVILDDPNTLRPPVAGQEPSPHLESFDEKREKTAEYTTWSLMSVPLFGPDGGVMGIIELRKTREGCAPFTPEDAELMKHYAGITSSLLANAGHFKQ